MLVLVIGSQMVSSHEKWAATTLQTQSVTDHKSTRTFPILSVDPSTVTDVQCERMAKEIQQLTEGFLMRRHYGHGIPDWTFVLSGSSVRSIIDSEHLCLIMAVETDDSSDDNSPTSETSTATPLSSETMSSTMSMPGSPEGGRDDGESFSPCLSPQSLDDPSSTKTNEEEVEEVECPANDTEVVVRTSNFVASTLTYLQSVSQWLITVGAATAEKVSSYPMSMVYEMKSTLTKAVFGLSQSLQPAALMSTLASSSVASKVSSLSGIPIAQAAAKLTSLSSSLAPCPEFLLADGNVKGCILAASYPALAGIRGRIEDTVVHPSASGQSFGKRLVSAAFDFLRSRQCVDVQLTSAYTRVTARNMYHEVGMHTRTACLYAKFLQEDDQPQQPL